ncbi:MAG: excinuclease ABC subunit UvrA [Phycisphaerae bacterium]
MADPVAKWIHIQGARTHNLRNVSLKIPRDRLVVVTGLSGSGKSSLAFDTIYAEGQRKYVESLSAYARQFLGQMSKPDADQITGLPPTIAIAQRSGRSTPRSTVATTTEVYDFLRLLFARAGTPHCPKCGRRVDRQTLARIVDAVLALPQQSRVMILAPLVRGRRGAHREVLKRILREGFIRVRVDGELREAKALPELDRRKAHTIEAVVDRIVIKPGLRTRLSESIEAALRLGDGLVVVAHQDASREPKPTDPWQETIHSERYACVRCDVRLPLMEPRLFSFNSPHGACPACDGLGRVPAFDPDLIVPDPKKPLDHGAIIAWQRAGQRLTGLYAKTLRSFCDRFGVSPATPYERVPARRREILMWGTRPEDEEAFGCHFEGVIPNLDRRWKTTKSQSVKSRLHEYLAERPCAACGGARLRPESLAVKLEGANIAGLTGRSIEHAAAFFDQLTLGGERGEVAAPILLEIRRRLRFMIDVGLGYLTLDRASNTLSGGESQRIRLATQVGSGLVGVCYVLDEPTIGLHPCDNARLLKTLRRLVDLGNTVLVVEHDADTIRAADWVVDIGPGAGAHGGRVLVNGPLSELRAAPESITAGYLRGDLTVRPPARRRSVSLSDVVEVRGAAENNLKSIDVRFPLGVFCCVTGVSGSGKSTLVNQILLRALKRRLDRAHDRPGAHDRLIGAGRIDQVIEIDQSPIGRTPRSNPATYAGVFDRVRGLYAKTREARLRGYTAGRFSFNVKGGRCEACQGQGTKRIEMHFLPDIHVQCTECKGTRYDRETLEVRYRGKSIADVLALRVEEALAFFDSFSAIRNLLQALCEVGLGYITLGQSADTLSGGEAQRIKLAAELGKSAAGRTLYILDEPTTGLHFADIDRLLDVLNRLCDLGHGILVIEHNLDVIRQADWIIDLGPEGGDAGGRVVAEGTPEQIAAHPDSRTGQYLRRHAAACAAGTAV